MLKHEHGVDDSSVPYAGCLQLLDTLPQSVYRVCDLLMVLTTRNGITWQTEVLTSLISQVLCCQFSVTWES